MKAALKHGAASLSQKDSFNDRDKVINDFCSGSVKTLIATNGFISALDSQTLNALIVFELPRHSSFCYEPNVYLRNVGRIGRAGQKSVVFNLIEESEVPIINRANTSFGVNAAHDQI